MIPRRVALYGIRACGLSFDVMVVNVDMMQLYNSSCAEGMYRSSSGGILASIAYILSKQRLHPNYRDENIGVRTRISFH